MVYAQGFGYVPFYEGNALHIAGEGGKLRFIQHLDDAVPSTILSLYYIAVSTILGMVSVAGILELESFILLSILNISKMVIMVIVVSTRTLTDLLVFSYRVSCSIGVHIEVVTIVFAVMNGVVQIYDYVDDGV